MTMHNRFFTILFVAALLVGCSGSSLDSDTDTPTPKVLVNAGTNQSVDEQTTVTLSAVASGQTDVLTYKWTVSPTLAITQSDTALGTATYCACCFRCTDLHFHC